MISLAEVQLWGRTIGAVQWDNQRQLGVFEYAPEFLRSGIQLSPLSMPLRAGRFSFPQLNRETFMGLPGLLADALPDKFGNLLIDQWLVAQGRDPGSFNPVERLLYMGQRGMGALEFAPATRQAAMSANPVELDELVSLANKALNQKRGLAVEMIEGREDSLALNQIIAVGTSAGGARAKAVIAWNEHTGEVRSGQCDTDSGFQHYLLKFDGVAANRDKELADPEGFTRIEYACYLMAIEAGIEMMPSRLLEENGRAHFLTRRFDRTDDGKKLHMQTLCGLAHYDFNIAGGYSYEQCFRVIRQVVKEQARAAQEQQFKRMLLNLMIRNQDDHTKNIGFLMNRAGQWSLAPAYDVTYAYNPDGAWTSTHQMSVNGKREQFTLDDLIDCGKAADLREREVKELIGEVGNAVRRWPDFANAAGVPEGWAQKIQATFREFA
jgi:serine/threonine-protein kinase HipA